MIRCFWIFWKGLKQVNKPNRKLTNVKVLKHVLCSPLLKCFYSSIHVFFSAGKYCRQGLFPVPAEIAREGQPCVSVGVNFQRGDVAALWKTTGHLPFEALKSDSWTPPKMELSAFWSWFTWHENHLCLPDAWENPGVSACSRLFSSAAACQLFTPTPENLCVSLKKRGCSRSPGCGRAPCVLWRGQDFRFMAFNKLPFRIKATSKRCLMFKGLSCYQQQHKQQQVVRKAFEPLWTQMPPIHTHTHTLKRWPSDPLTRYYNATGREVYLELSSLEASFCWFIRYWGSSLKLTNPNSQLPLSP